MNLEDWQTRVDASTATCARTTPMRSMRRRSRSRRYRASDEQYVRMRFQQQLRARLHRHGRADVSRRKSAHPRANSRPPFVRRMLRPVSRVAPGFPFGFPQGVRVRMFCGRMPESENEAVGRRIAGAMVRELPGKPLSPR
ncbi:MAG: hypothetical protein ACLT98_09125 [Eggerthellaceae bacterium]